MKKIRILGFLLVIAISCFFGTRLFLEQSDEIVMNGNVEIQDVNLSFRVPGRISVVPVDEGDSVKKGEVVAQIDSDILREQCELAKSKLEASKISLKINEKNYERNRELFKKRSISEKIFEDVLLKYETSKSEVKIAVSNYKLAEIQLKDAVLRSPVDGVVLTRNIEVGEFISAGIPAFSLMPFQQTRIRTFVNDEILARVKHNDKVQVSIDSLPNKEFPGHIAFISPESEFTPKNIETKELRPSLMYRVRVIMDRQVPELKQGMPVTMRITAK